MTLAKTAGLGQTLYQCRVMTITPDGSAIVCPSSTITDIAKNGTMTYSTGFPEFSVTTGRLIRITGHWPRKQNDPFVYARALVRRLGPGPHRHDPLGGP